MANQDWLLSRVKFVDVQEFSVLGFKIFSGEDWPPSEAHRAFGYLFAMAFGLIAGILTTTETISDADYGSIVSWAVGCLVGSLFLIVASTSKPACRARRLFRSSLCAFVAFFVAAAANLQIWNSVIDIAMGLNVALGCCVLYFLVIWERRQRKGAGETTFAQRDAYVARKFAHLAGAIMIRYQETAERPGWSAIRTEGISYAALAGLVAVLIKVARL